MGKNHQPRRRKTADPNQGSPPRRLSRDNHTGRFVSTPKNPQANSEIDVGGAVGERSTNAKRPTSAREKSSRPKKSSCSEQIAGGSHDKVQVAPLSPPPVTAGEELALETSPPPPPRPMKNVHSPHMGELAPQRHPSQHLPAPIYYSNPVEFVNRTLPSQPGYQLSFQEYPPAHVQFAYAHQPSDVYPSFTNVQPQSVGATDYPGHHQGLHRESPERQGNDFHEFVRHIYSNPTYDLVRDDVGGNEPATTEVEAVNKAAWMRCTQIQQAAEQFGLDYASKVFGPTDLFMAALFTVCRGIPNNSNNMRTQVAVPTEVNRAMIPNRMNALTNTNASSPRVPLSEHAKEVLQNWFSQHWKNPFPSAVEKQALCEQAGLNLVQVNNWFANKRQREKRKVLRGAALLAPVAKWRRVMNRANDEERVETEVDPYHIDAQRSGMPAPNMFNFTANQGGSSAQRSVPGNLVNNDDRRNPPIRSYPVPPTGVAGSDGMPPTK